MVSRLGEEEIDRTLSWREGFLVFDDLSLVEVVAEFNRYNRTKMVVMDPELEKIRIGGKFRSGNVETFSRLLTEGFDLRVERKRGLIEIYAHR